MNSYEEIEINWWKAVPIVIVMLLLYAVVWIFTLPLKLWHLPYAIQWGGLLFGLLLLHQYHGHYSHVGRHVNVHGEAEQGDVLKAWYREHGWIK